MSFSGARQVARARELGVTKVGPIKFSLVWLDGWVFPWLRISVVTVYLKFSPDQLSLAKVVFSPSPET